MTNEADVAPSRRSKIETLAQLRILVAFLGEKDQFDWWPTSFLTPTGLKFLEYNFPRTIVSAAVHSITHAAKQLHDQKIGKAGSFHLFRLPHDFEQDIHSVILEASREKFGHLFSSKSQSLEELKSLTDGESVEAVGPIRIAGVGQLTSKQSLRKVSAYYAYAFQSQTQVFPYFTTE